MTKRIAAIALAILMILAVVPSAFAAGSYSFTLQNTKPGYTYDVYKVATVASDGSYTAEAGVDADVVTALGATTSNSTQDLLNALNAATGLGTKIGSFATADASTKAFTGLDEGIYYVKGVGTPVATASHIRNSVIVLPANDGQTVNLIDKVKEGDEPGIEKTFGDGTKATKEVSSSDVIAYTLTGDVTGTASNKLVKYEIKDELSTSLDLSEVTITSVKLDGTTDLEYTKTDDTASNSFTIAIKASELEKDSFYDGTTVVVNFTTKLTADAVRKQNIPNKSVLTYQLPGQDSKDKPSNEVNVITYGIKVTKVDADTKATITDSEATFALYSDAACTNKIEEKQTTNGVVTFDTRVKTGTYYVKETVAPQGYNLNKDVLTVTVTASNEFAQLTAEDTKTVLPDTGGAGTMIFTIVGLALIAAAGVMFVVVMRKRSAK